MDYLDFIILVFLIYISALPQVVSDLGCNLWLFHISNFIMPEIQNAEAGLLQFSFILVVCSVFFPSIHRFR